MSQAPNGNDTKQVFAMIVSMVMVYKTDLSRMTPEQTEKYLDRLTDISCDIAEQLDQKFKARGWDK